MPGLGVIQGLELRIERVGTTDTKHLSMTVGFELRALGFGLIKGLGV